MGRKLLMGMVVMAAVATPTAWPEAAPAKPSAAPKVTTGMVKGESTLRAEAGRVVFSKRVGRDQVVMRLEAPRDRIDLELNTDGRVRIVRNGKVLTLQMKEDPANAVEQVKRLTSGSVALAGLDSLVAGLANDQRLEAQSLLVSHALVQALRGNSAPAMAFAARQAPRTDGAIVRVMGRTTEEGPYACWAEYAQTVDQYLVQFNDCVSLYWWIPGWNAACGAQFSLQSELAFFWLISCSGGMPV